MIRIMIVDDMPIFLEYLRNCIDWGAYGFEICGEAHDGKEALEMIEEDAPDIILTDITMPYVNGLELAEQVMERYPDISIILITGNNEFEYARKAVKIGVCDYIVKPFEKEELILSLLKLQDNISRALELKTEKEEIENHRREMVLRKLILSKESQEIEGSAFQNQLERLNVSFCSPYFLVCTLKFVTFRMGELEQLNNWESIISNMLKDKLEMDGTCQVFRDFENSIILLLNFKNENQMKSYKIYELSDLNKIIKEQLHIDAVIGVSDFCYGITNIKTAYSQTLQLLARKAESSGKVFDYKKMVQEEKERYYSWEAIEELNQGLEQLNKELVSQIIREELKKVTGDINNQINTVLYTGFISILLTNLVNAGRNVDDIFGEKFMPYEDIKEMTSHEERENQIISYYVQAMDYQKLNANTKSRVVMENARSYIEEHYTDPDLSIVDISKALLINQTYLRKMFKSEMNLTLSEYITKYRMGIAMRLIQETEDKLTVIAEKVGYSDVSYFSKCFKKFYGITPKNVV